MTQSDDPKPFSLPSMEDVVSLLSKLKSAVADIKSDSDDVAERSIKDVVGQAKQSVESVASTLQTIQQTLENLNRVALRVDRLLDDVEDPIRKILSSMPPTSNETTIV